MKYEKPQMEIMELVTVDVITTSDSGSSNVGGPWD